MKFAKNKVQPLKQGQESLSGGLFRTNFESVHDFEKLIVEGGFCIGCGACTIETQPEGRMVFRDGCYVPNLPESPETDPRNLFAVCPFGALSDQEDTIASTAFAGKKFKTSRKLGRYLSLYAAHVMDEKVRLSASSGGIARWLLSELLAQGLVDKVVQVAKNENPTGPLYEYRVFSDPSDVLLGAKSAYYPVEMSKVLKQIRGSRERFAITAVPCFAKMLKAATLRDEHMRARLPFIIGLFCGHLKSAWYAQSVAWSEGIHPGELRALDFRGKNKERAVADKEYQMIGVQPDGSKVVRNKFEGEAFGTDWGQGLLKYTACDYCDDVAAETADITVGDVWLPEYMQDWRGSSLLVVRSEALLQILQEAARNGSISLKDLTERQVISSQEAGFRHRREGLALRLGIKEEAGEWHPRKRTAADFKPDTNWEKCLFRLRMKLTRVSYDAFRSALKEGSFAVFRNEMVPLMNEYEEHYQRQPLGRRINGKLRRSANNLLIKMDRLIAAFKQCWSL